MLNHVHGFVWIVARSGCKDVAQGSKKSGVRATGRLPIQNAEFSVTGPSPKSLSSFVAGYKSAVTKKINKMRGAPGKPVWMRNFHDRVIRNEQELQAIREYIRNNPTKWELDKNYVN
jgi:REP element-mobilizing transposase RayT